MVRKPTRMPFSAGPPRGERERPQGGSWTLGCSPQSPLKPVRTSPLQSLVQSTCVGGRKTEVPPSPLGERALCGVSSRRAPTGYRDAPTLASASFPSSSTSGGGAPTLSLSDERARLQRFFTYAIWQIPETSVRQAQVSRCLFRTTEASAPWANLLVSRCWPFPGVTGDSRYWFLAPSQHGGGSQSRSRSWMGDPPWALGVLAERAVTGHDPLWSLSLLLT